MGEILYPISIDNQDSRAMGQHQTNSKKSDSKNGLRRGDSLLEADLLRPTHLLSTAEEMAVFAKSIQVDDNSQRSYIRYCEDFTEPEVYIEEKSCYSEYDFTTSLRPLSVDYEDVGGMEDLAASSYIGDIVSTGPYEGMQQGESAILATALTSSTLVFVEPHLQSEVLPSPSQQDLFSASTNLLNTKPSSAKFASMSLPSISSRSSSFSQYGSLLVSPNKADLLMGPDERVPSMQKKQSLINKRASTKYAVELTEQSKTKMEDIWNANTNFSQVGLEEEIQSSLNKYLYSQHIYGQEVDPDRLAKR